MSALPFCRSYFEDLPDSAEAATSSSAAEPPPGDAAAAASPPRRDADAPPRAGARRGAAAAPAPTLDDVAAATRRGVVGAGAAIETPYGTRRLAYTDWAASGRALAPVEDYIRREVLPLYGNTHTTTSATGLQSTCFLVEARASVAAAANARCQYGDAASDIVLFTGGGATSAAVKLVHALGLDAPLPPGTPHTHRPLVLVGPHEHHSNLLPWRESCAAVLQLPEASHGRGVCLSALRAALSHYTQSGTTPLIVGTFAAASNVTGCVEDVEGVTWLLHAFGALSVWDYAAAGCGGPSLDMNPPGGLAASKDAVLLSPHKLAGGAGAAGVLVAKRRLFRNAVPSAPGGGTVFFVTAAGHRYVSNREEREEGGTPELLAALRAAAALRAKTAAERAAAATATTPSAPDAPPGEPRAAPCHGVAAAASAVAARLYASLASNPAITVLGPPMAPGEHRLPVVSFLIRAPRGCGGGRWLHPSFVCAALNDVFGLQTRGGCDCAGPYGLALLGINAADAAAIEAELELKSAWAEALRPGWTRLSLPWFASQAEVGYALAAVHAIAVHGWRLLPAYRFNPRSGEWKHASRLSRTPQRKWLASLRWPAADDVAADAADDVAAGLRTPQAEAALEAAWAAHLEQAAEIFFAAAATTTAARGGGGDAYGNGVAEAEGGAAAAAGGDATSALRWFALPSEAAVALGAEPRRDVAWYASGTMAPGAELPRAAADVAAARGGWADAPPPAGPVRPRRYGGTDADVAAAWAPPGATATTADAAAADVAVASGAAWAAASRKHPLRSSEDGPAFADVAALAALRHGAPPAPAAANGAAAPPPPPPPPPPATAPAAQSVADASDTEALPLPPPPESTPAVLTTAPPMPHPASGRVAPPRPLLALVSRAIAEWDMIRPGDRLLLGLSGGKDSLALLHILLDLRARAPVRFELAAATVDPGTESYNPRPLIEYVGSLGVPYHFLSNRIFDDAASGAMSGDSICSFCARMKRGALYSCARAHGYTTLVLGQHLDDMAESLLMSAFHNGALRTMQAAYTNSAGDVRVVRPLLHCREAALKAFSYGAGLPVIADNCPACFEAPKERARIKKLLRREEEMFPRLFANLDAAMAPLEDARLPPLLRSLSASLAGRRHANKPAHNAARRVAEARAAAAVGEQQLAPGAADVADDVAEVLRGVPEKALLAELARRGGLGIGAAAAAAAAGAVDDADDAAAAAAGNAACAWRPRAQRRADDAATDA